MAILKKIEANTLMETLVAAVLVISVFMLSSAILNNLFLGSIQSDLHPINNHLSKLQYLNRCRKIKLPYTSTYKGWDVIITNDANKQVILFEAKHNKTNKAINFIENAN